MSFSDAVVIEASLRPVKVLITRELQNSIDDSIKAEIEAAIENRDLGHFFKITRDKIVGRNGSEFIFKGLKNNIKSIKSISNVDIVLVEEADSVSKKSWDVFLPSIRPKEPHRQDPVIIVIFNPDSELDDTYQRFVTNPPDECISKLINFNDNKYFPNHLEKQRLHCLRTRPKRDYEHIWKGKPTGSEGEGIIDLEWIKAARFASLEWEKRTGNVWPQGEVTAAYDPSGQGRDFNAVVINDSNRIGLIDEWLKSDDLRKASERAFRLAVGCGADRFVFDTCGGLGDGVEVFVDEAKDAYEIKNSLVDCLVINPFDAGSSVVNPDQEIEGTTKTNGEMYSNAKAQVHGVTAQLLYNTYRFIMLEEDINPCDMLSIDVGDDELFNKLARELSTPLWIKSLTNSKKRVEDKAMMLKRTGQVSPNIGDAIHMSNAQFDTTMEDLLKLAVGAN